MPKPRILINHLGYGRLKPKKAVIQADRENGHPLRNLPCVIVDADTGTAVRRGQASFSGSVDRWKDWVFWSFDFSDFTSTGSFFIECSGARSPVFPVGEAPLRGTLPAVLRYFRSQRCAGIWDQADRRAPFFGGRSDRVDVHGGWFDASGDKSKYLSHLSYANYMNPQQSPMAVWSFLSSREALEEGAPQDLRQELLEEARYGAEFLCRMQDPAGYFYTTVFDRWSKDPELREICSYRGQEGIKSDAYQAGYRQGGGMAIAALAGTSRLPEIAPSDRAMYLQAAAKGFRHLEEHNPEYLDDRRENIIDDYCALLASTELYRASGGEDVYLQAARLRAEKLAQRVAQDERYSGWWRADERGKRPFFHAAEAGLPVLALLRYLEAEPDEGRAARAEAAVRRSLEFELSLTAEVPNPFGYARQYVKALGGERRSAFFFPHVNESGYWWQGENARLASLAAAARLACRHFRSDRDFCSRLARYASNQMDWILGLNPFDACMLHGFGRNNPEYEEKFPNAYGGICNGITGGFADERDIDFLPLPQAGEGRHRWRWSEQWLPHAAWFLLAVCA